jgi:hypothetical protein
MRCDISAQQVIDPVSSSGGSQNVAFASVRTDVQIYILDFVLSSFQNITGTTSNFWTISFDWLSATNVGTSLASLNTKTSAINNWVAQRATVNAVLSSSARALRINVTPSGTAGVLYPICHYTYRQVVT